MGASLSRFESRVAYALCGHAGAVGAGRRRRATAPAPPADRARRVVASRDPHVPGDTRQYVAVRDGGDGGGSGSKMSNCRRSFIPCPRIGRHTDLCGNSGETRARAHWAPARTGFRRGRPECLGETAGRRRGAGGRVAPVHRSDPAGGRNVPACVTRFRHGPPPPRTAAPPRPRHAGRAARADPSLTRTPMTQTAAASLGATETPCRGGRTRTCDQGLMRPPEPVLIGP